MKKIALFTLLLLIPVLASCKKDDLEAPELLEPVGVVIDKEVVAKGNLTQTDAYSGYITPSSKAVYFQSEGRIAEMAAFSGKWVEEGDILLELATDGLDENIETLQDDVAFLQKEIEYERSLGSYDVQILSLEAESMKDVEGMEEAYKAKLLEIERVSLSVKQSTEIKEREIAEKNKEIEKLLETREENVIRANFAGHVYIPNGLSKGKAVHKDEAAAFIINDDETCFRAQIFLSEQSYKRYHVTLLMNGEMYEVRLIPKTQEEIQAMYVSGKEMTSDFEVILPPGETMPESGTYGALLVDVKGAEDVVLVNSMAVSHDGSGDYVYVIEDEKRVRRDIITGITNGIQTEVISGLQEGEVVYVQN